MKILLLFCAFVFQSVSFASMNCWQSCTASGKSTSRCASKCGIATQAEFVFCHEYCDHRGGSAATCRYLCGGRGDSSSTDGSGMSQADRDSLDRAAGRSRLEDCARRSCSQQEIDDAWGQANRGGSSRDDSYYEQDGSGLSQADRDALDRAAADSARQDAEDELRRRQREENQ